MRAVLVLLCLPVLFSATNDPKVWSLSTDDTRGAEITTWPDSGPQPPVPVSTSQAFICPSKVPFLYTSLFMSLEGVSSLCLTLSIGVSTHLVLVRLHLH